MELMKTNVSTDAANITLNIGEIEIPGKLMMKNVNISAEGETSITDAVASLQTGITKAVLEATWFGHLAMVLATKADRLIELIISGISLSLDRERYNFEQEKEKDKENKQKEEEKSATE